MYTDAQLVERYLQLREYVAAENEAHTERLKPYVDGMAALENAMQGLLIERNADNSKTEFGTFFKVTHMQTKVADKSALFAHVVNTNNFDLLIGNVAKDSVKAYMDKSGGHPPPGVETTFITKINVRRSS